MYLCISDTVPHWVRTPVLVVLTRAAAQPHTASATLYLTGCRTPVLVALTRAAPQPHTMVALTRAHAAAQPHTISVRYSVALSLMHNPLGATPPFRWRSPAHPHTISLDCAPATLYLTGCRTPTYYLSGLCPLTPCDTQHIGTGEHKCRNELIETQ